MSWRRRRRARRSGAQALLAGVGGAGAMYLLDPDRGRRRRAWLRDKAVHAAHALGDAGDKTARDFAHRVQGTLAESRSLWRRQVPDAVLEDRVRAELGRWVSHPGSVHVAVNEGRVTLTGPLLAGEQDRLLDGIRRVRGVQEVGDRLEPHRAADGVPGLQGGIPRRGRLPELLQTNWAPAARLLAGLAGAALAGWGARRRGSFGVALGLSGASLFLRAATNLPARRLVGIGAGRRAIDFRKTLDVKAPIDEVFELWSHAENFPRFMEHVRAVTAGAGGRFHWKVAGPAGIPAEWDAEITRLEPNRVFAWRSLPGSAVENAGIVRFEELPGGRTRLDIRLSYNPPAGALGHVLASLFRADPKSAMDDDLLRLKSLLEFGKASAHGESVTKEEIVEHPAPPAPLG